MEECSGYVARQGVRVLLTKRVSVVDTTTIAFNSGDTGSNLCGAHPWSVVECVVHRLSRRDPPWSRRLGVCNGIGESQGESFLFQELANCNAWVMTGHAATEVKEGTGRRMISNNTCQSM